ncbi:lipopolysaccharide kinase InaA family protein [Nitratifractor sp.]
MNRQDKKRKKVHPPSWIDEAIAQNAGSEIFRWEADGKGYWIKHGRPTGSTKIHALGYRLSGLPFLHPVEAKDPRQSVLFEAQKLQRLHEAGLPVPPVRWITSDFFVMEDRGESLADRLKSVSSDEREMLLGKCVDALGALHRAGEYHGASQIRNFVLDSNGTVSIIDFEESFPSTASLRSLQFRDLFLLLYSLHRQRTETDYPRLIERYMRSSGNDDFAFELHRLYRRFSWIARLVAVDGIRHRLGSDAEILHRLFESIRR